VQDRYDTDIDDLWSALTDPRRLARWLGDVEGDLRLGGEFRAHFLASGWEGTGLVEACEPPRRLLVSTWQEGETHDHFIEATLTADGGQTVLVWEERGRSSSPPTRSWERIRACRPEPGSPGCKTAPPRSSP
jgi:uncharacterized protein YndB with AHSA1/START domain